MIAHPDQVGEVFAGDIALAADLERLVPARPQLLDAALEADAQRVCGEAENLPDGSRDASRVDVRVVDFPELGGDFGAEAVGKGLRDLVEDVVSCC